MLSTYQVISLYHARRDSYISKSNSLPAATILHNLHNITKKYEKFEDRAKEIRRKKSRKLINYVPNGANDQVRQILTLTSNFCQVVSPFFINWTKVHYMERRLCTLICAMFFCIFN